MDRADREAYLSNPALSFGLALQPGILADVANNKRFFDSGLLARFLYAMPESTVGKRDVRNRVGMPAEIVSRYEVGISKLLEGRRLVPDTPSVLMFDPDALECWVEFLEEIEGQLAGDAPEAVIQWKSKLAGAAARISGLIELADGMGYASSIRTNSITRAIGYEARTVPRGCLLLTCGVDVQKDRFAVLVLGHGRDGVQWVIDYVELPADPTRPDEWSKIDAYIDEPRQSNSGAPIRISLTAIDSGYLTDDVLNYTRARRHRGVIAVKGSSTQNRPIITKGNKVDFTWRGSTIKHGAEIWLVGGDTAKHQLFARLTADRKHPEHERLIRLPNGLDESFYSQLTAEVFDSTKRRWVKIRQRNEALDTFCYAVAASMHPNLRVNTWKEPRWALLEAVIEPEADLFSAPLAREDRPKPKAAAADLPIKFNQAQVAPSHGNGFGSSEWAL